MKKKIVGMFVCTLLFATLVPMTVTADETFGKTITVDDVDVEVYAGLFGRDIGFGISIKTENSRNESVPVHFILMEVTPRWWTQIEDNYSARQGRHDVSLGVYGFGFFYIQVDVEDITIARRGITIGGLVIMRPGEIEPEC